jgi:hypothetical protein
VIYLPLSMTCAVRALCVLLTVWLGVAGSLPTCCWSLIEAHDHAASQRSDANQPQASEHHHHGIGESTAAAAPASSLSAVPERDCGTTSDTAFLTTGTAASLIGMRAIAADATDVAVPQPTALLARRSDHAPPGGSFSAAFLNSLRV